MVRETGIVDERWRTHGRRRCEQEGVALRGNSESSHLSRAQSVPERHNYSESQGEPGMDLRRSKGAKRTECSVQVLYRRKDSVDLVRKCWMAE